MKLQAADVERERAIDLREENARLNVALAFAKDQLEVSREQIDTARVRHEGECAELRTEVARAQTKLAGVMEQAAQVREELDHARSKHGGEVAQLRDDATRLQSALEEFKQQSLQTRQELDAARLEHEDELRRLRDSLIRSQTAFEGVSAQAAQVRQELDATRLQHEGELLRLHDALTRSQTAFAQAGDQAAKTRQHLEAARLQHEDELLRLHDALARSQTALAQVSEQATQARQDLKATRLRQQDDLRRFHDALNRAQTAFVQVSKQATQRRRDFEAARLQHASETQQLLDALARSQTSYALVSNQAADTQRQLEAARLQHAKEATQLQEATTHLQAALEQLGQQSARAQQEFDAARIQHREELAQLTLHFQERDAKCLALQREIGATHAEHRKVTESLERAMRGLRLTLAHRNAVLFELQNASAAQHAQDTVNLAKWEKQANLIARALFERTGAARSTDLQSYRIPSSSATYISAENILSTTQSLEIILQLRADLRGGKALLVFGMNDWHFRMQRPQHIATELARSGQTVIYISPVFIDNLSPGYSLKRIAENLYEAQLHRFSPKPIHCHGADPDSIAQLITGLRFMLDAMAPSGLVCLLQHPFWYPVAGSLSTHPIRLIYERFDNVRSFPRTPASVIELEDHLLENSDVIICSSMNLAESTSAVTNNPCFLVRNGCDFEHFNAAAMPMPDSSRRPIIGYFGAIEDWFDGDLVEQLAIEIPDVQIILIGRDEIGLTEKFRDLHNVQLFGEVPYAELPAHLNRFDVCIVPFILNDLTAATDPIKVYEYLASGRPVVATALPELGPCATMIHIADNRAEFITLVRKALGEGESNLIRKQRIAFASNNSWQARAAEMQLILNRLC